MLSPAAQYVMRMHAAQAVALADKRPPHYANQYELMLAKLDEDKRRLKTVQSMEKKAEIKRTLLDDYAPWVDGILKTSAGIQDDVLMTIMVWRIDANDFSGALDIARYALMHKLSLPDRYQRTTACLLAEEFAEAAFRARATDSEINITCLIEVEKLTQAEDMPDQVRAKLHKALAYGLMTSQSKNEEYECSAQASEDVTSRLENKKSALTHLRRAWQLHDKSGVKKDIELLERAIKHANRGSINNDMIIPEDGVG